MLTASQLKSPSLFWNELARIVRPHQSDPLYWPSENDDEGAVSVIDLPDSEVFDWVPESIEHDEHLTEFVLPCLVLEEVGNSLDADPRFAQLAEVFELRMPNGRVFYRQTDEKSVYAYYLLVRFGSRWIGLKTKVVET